VGADTEQRKLAAIMFTDMVGYSALSQRDGKLALELLEEHRQLLREIFPRFNGTEIKTIGDAFLVEFNSALEAAECAIAIQRALAKRNADAAAERQIQVRIGIHIGDVVHRGGDVYGDGVNIASRIEPLAGAGGICVSTDVERQIRNSLGARFEKLAPTELKNISVAMDLFRIVLPWEQKSAVRGHRSEVRKSSVVPSNTKSALIGALGLLLVIGVGWWWTTQPRKSVSSPAAPSAPHASDQKSIAVLPFVDLSPAHDQEYFCDGISEEILDALAKVGGLRVVARTSSFSFKGTNADVGDIARKLNVQNVLEGSLRREGNRIRITAQLINARDGFHMWSDTFERELQGVFAVQDEITHAIVDALKVKLAVAPSARAQLNTESHDLYLKGRFYWNKRTTDTIKKAIDYFNEAIGKDPEYALAYAGLADCYSSLGFNFDAGLLAPAQAIPKAKAAALKALEIDDALAEAHTSLAFIKLNYDWDWPGAEKDFKRAIELNPNYDNAHHWYSHYLTAMGRTDESFLESKRALELDPVGLVMNVHLGWHYFYARQYDQAVEQLQKTIEMDPNRGFTHWYLGLALEQQGKYQKATSELQKGHALLGDNLGVEADLGHTYAVSGNREAAQRMIEELKELSAQRYVAAYHVALIYTGLGEKAEAFQWLEKAYQERSDLLVYLKVEPRLDSLRSDPRFANFLLRIGLDRTKLANQHERQ
jgi:adenylate cyclase